MNESTAPRFGDLLRTLRKRAGMTQEELAERAGLSRDAISALERGRRNRPHPPTMAAIIDALGLSEADQKALRAATRNSIEVELPEPRSAVRSIPVLATRLIG